MTQHHHRRQRFTRTRKVRAPARLTAGRTPSPRAYGLCITAPSPYSHRMHAAYRAYAKCQAGGR